MKRIFGASTSRTAATWRHGAWKAALCPLACAILLGCPSNTAEPRSANTAGTGGGEGGATGGEGTTATPGPVDLGAAVVNARQVGGLATAGGQRVRAGVLIRSGELSQVDCAGSRRSGSRPSSICATPPTRGPPPTRPA